MSRLVFLRKRPFGEILGKKPSYARFGPHFETLRFWMDCKTAGRWLEEEKSLQGTGRDCLKSRA
jgi:hypothetical protein